MTDQSENNWPRRVRGSSDCAERGVSPRVDERNREPVATAAASGDGDRRREEPAEAVRRFPDPEPVEVEAETGTPVFASNVWSDVEIARTGYIEAALAPLLAQLDEIERWLRRRLAEAHAGEQPPP